MAQKWTADPDGWESSTWKDGGTDYRMLAYDTGTPRFQGAAKRYAWVYLMSDGTVTSKSAEGYARRHATVEEAKNAVQPKRVLAP